MNRKRAGEKPSPLIEWRNRILLVVGSALFVAVALEIYARLAGAPIVIRMRGELGVQAFEHDPLLGYVNRPGAVLPPNPKSPVEMKINRLGYRGPEYAIEKAPGTRRVILLGDSYGFGLGLDYDSTLAAVIDREIDNCEVINFSAPGYNTTIELLQLERDAHRFEPDLVILLYCPNDLRGNILEYTKHNRVPYYTLENGDSLVLHGVPVPEEKFEMDEGKRTFGDLLSQSAGYRLLRYRLGTVLGSTGERKGKDFMDAWRDALPLVGTFVEGERLTRALIGRISRVAESMGAPVILVSTVQERQITIGGSLYKMENSFAPLAQSDPNLYWIDLRPGFGEELDSHKLWLPYNGHWNGRANGLAARAVIALIQRNELL